jgi:hypothetical protein
MQWQDIDINVNTDDKVQKSDKIFLCLASLVSGVKIH